MGAEPVLIFRNGKWQRLFYSRVTVTADGRWTPLDLPTDGVRLYVRNESATAALHVSFAEKPEDAASNDQHFTLTSTAGTGFDRAMDFIPRHCWVRAQEANHVFYYEVLDETESEEEVD